MHLHKRPQIDGICRCSPLPQTRRYKTYINALSEDEVDVIRISSFKKCIYWADQLTFSGHLGRYLLS
ncbi:hypothetical protein YC2023_041343 [Brassica napus]